MYVCVCVCVCVCAVNVFYLYMNLFPERRVDRSVLSKIWLWMEQLSSYTLRSVYPYNQTTIPLSSKA